jgi:hypothetical protein
VEKALAQGRTKRPESWTPKLPAMNKQKNVSKKNIKANVNLTSREWGTL